MRNLLARLFLPSWRFFDDAFSSTVLQGCVVSADGGCSAWTDLLEPPTRRSAHLLWNPWGNLTLAKYSLVERMVDEASEASGDPAQLVSYELVVHLAREELRGSHTPASTGFRFRVVERDAKGDSDALLSAEHPW